MRLYIIAIYMYYISFCENDFWLNSRTRESVSQVQCVKDYSVRTTSDSQNGLPNAEIRCSLVVSKAEYLNPFVSIR